MRVLLAVVVWTVLAECFIRKWSFLTLILFCCHFSAVCPCMIWWGVFYSCFLTESSLFVHANLHRGADHLTRYGTKSKSVIDTLDKTTAFHSGEVFLVLLSVCILVHFGGGKQNLFQIRFYVIRNTNDWWEIILVLFSCDNVIPLQQNWVDGVFLPLNIAEQIKEINIGDFLLPHVTITGIFTSVDDFC